MKTPNPYIPTKALLRTIFKMSEDNYLFQFTVEPGTIGRCMPGQFLEVWIPGVGECPISVCSDSMDGLIELCVHRTGRVTDALFKMEEGDWLGLRGPYGTGYPVEKMEGNNIILVAGGLGIAPIRSLLQYILHRRERFGDLIIAYGMRHSLDLLFRHEMTSLYSRNDMHLFIGAEEVDFPEIPPIHAQLGRVTDMLRMAQFDGTYLAAVCGPPVMYPFVIRELKEGGITENNIFLSLERHMKCAIGKCGHCFVGGVYACKEGPVFPLEDLRFIPEVVECVNC
ncbi:MAG: oxidoreductase [Cyanobacteria bacterium PR.3.49]|nr:oxidoreductase [Cyanobacteria bacterium PR.3.49]